MKRQPRVLVIGSGGREHALAWSLARSPRRPKVYVAPGNAGTALEAGMQNISMSDPDGWLNFALREKIDLTVVGPEAPLAAGVVDRFREHGLPIFGPTRAAAQLEASKEFAKAFMQRHHIPTAAYKSFSESQAAHAWLETQGAPIVVKADGLAAGKGVVVAATLAEAHAAVDQMLLANTEDGRVVIEDCLEGEEASFIVMSDGVNILPLASSQDHKRVGEGDTGANTGGMGAYSPAPVVTPAVHERAMREVIAPAIQGMAAEGEAYTGFLYAGLIIAPDGTLKTLEFNCRMGDPETQPILMRLQTDLLDLIEASVEGQLDQAEATWDPRTALGVVMTAEYYPQAPRTGDTIQGLTKETPADTHVFHAGTKLEGDTVITSGGRVLCVTALGENVQQAQQRAYALCEQIHWPGAYYRRDIGHRAAQS